jgi:hypothetical protein
VHVLVGLLGAAALAACAPPAHVESAPSPVTGRVVVHNHTQHELVLFLSRPGKVWRLGMVGARGDASVAVPAEVHPEAGDFQLMAWKIGGPFFSSESFSLLGGVTAEWSIGREAAQSLASRSIEQGAAESVALQSIGQEAAPSLASRR